MKASEKHHENTVFGVKGDQIRIDLTDLAKNSGIKLTGKIRPHNLRKWVMSSLDKAGFTEFQTKFIMGKSIGKSDMTYLTSLKNIIEEKYPKLYDKYLNILNHSKQQTIQQDTITQLTSENSELKSAILGLLKASPQIHKAVVKTWLKQNKSDPLKTRPNLIAMLIDLGKQT